MPYIHWTMQINLSQVKIGRKLSFKMFYFREEQGAMLQIRFYRKVLFTLSISDNEDSSIKFEIDGEISKWSIGNVMWETFH